MDIRQYIIDNERTYTYRIKTVFELDDAQMDRLERALLKYSPVDISRPRKTILQKNPLDFKTIDAAEVFIVDIELAMPASSFVLHQELCRAFKPMQGDGDIGMDYLVVRSFNDPKEIESAGVLAMEEMEEEAHAAGKEQAGILNDPDYEDGQEPEELAGDGYTKKFLSYLRKVSKEKPTQKKVDAAHPLSVWKDMPAPEKTDEGDYNANIEGAPTIGKLDGGTGPDAEVSNAGNLTDEKRTYKRLYGKDGVRTMSSKSVDTKKGPQ